MQNNFMNQYHKDDFYLIFDPTYKAEKYIGKVFTISPDGLATLNIYIFPEDTLEGRKAYMSYYEIFLTKDEMTHQFNGTETQVNVTDLKSYIERKFVQKEDISIRQLYFQRQIYLENGRLEPGLERVCYCQQFFNPDYIFKTCNCGCFFHPICFMKSDTNKCWNQKCNIDCSVFFSPEEMLDKKRKINHLQINSPTPSNLVQKPSIIMTDKFFEMRNKANNSRQNISNFKVEEISKFDTGEIIKKTKKRDNEMNGTIDIYLNKSTANVQEREKEIKIKPEPFINLGIKKEKNVVSPVKLSKIFDTTIYEKKPGGGYQVQIKSEVNTLEELKKRTETEREKARKIIYENLLNGIKYLQKNDPILDNLEKNNPKFKQTISLIKENNLINIELHFRELANSIENNLFNNCGQKTQGSYFFTFLQEFALLIKNSKNILFRVILGDLTAEEISKFKEEDFLPEEKRREKEELKKKEIKKIQFTGPNKVYVVSNKGRMLTEIQDNIEINKNNIGLENQINMNVVETPKFSEYYEKLKNMKDKYPNMSENEVKFLVEAKEPDGEEIGNKLNTIIQKTLDLEEQRELLISREKILKKKAEKHFKKIKDKTDENLLRKKTQDYIKRISFDIKAY